MSHHCPFCDSGDINKAYADPTVVSICDTCASPVSDPEPELIPSWEEYDTAPPLITPWED